MKCFGLSESYLGEPDFIEAMKYFKFIQNLIIYTDHQGCLLIEDIATLIKIIFNKVLLIILIFQLNQKMKILE
jgi:hypothetical protein